MKGKSLAFFVGLCLLPTTEGHGRAPAAGVILPGKGISGVELGAPLASFEKIFPMRPNIDQELPVNSCGISGYHWVDVDRGATGVYAYTKDGEITQLSVQTPRFSMQNGIKMDSPENDVKHAYPHGKSYVLLHSGGTVVGGRDLVYWVDKQAGVAFELYWNTKRSQRLVGGIEVFKKGTEYLPEGCISIPQQWEQIR
jgi:hypothetical protein